MLLVMLNTCRCQLEPATQQLQGFVQLAMLGPNRLFAEQLHSDAAAWLIVQLPSRILCMGCCCCRRIQGLLHSLAGLLGGGGKAYWWLETPAGELLELSLLVVVDASHQCRPHGKRSLECSTADARLDVQALQPLQLLLRGCCSRSRDNIVCDASPDTQCVARCKTSGALTWSATADVSRSE